MDNEKMGAFIATLRKEKNLTQQDLADMLGVTNKAVSKWERGDGYPEITIVPALAETLDVTVDELLNGERAEIVQVVTPRAEIQQERYGWLLEKALMRYKNLTLISFGLLLVGLLAFFVIFFAWFSFVGYGVAIIMLIVGGVLYGIFYNNLKANEKKYIKMEGEAVLYQNTVAERCKRNIAFVWAMVFSFLIPTLFMAIQVYMKLAAVGIASLRFVASHELIYLIIGSWVMSLITIAMKKRCKTSGYPCQGSKYKILSWVLNGLAALVTALNLYALLVVVFFTVTDYLIVLACNLLIVAAVVINLRRYRG